MKIYACFMAKDPEFKKPVECYDLLVSDNGKKMIDEYGLKVLDKFAKYLVDGYKVTAEFELRK